MLQKGRCVMPVQTRHRLELTLKGAPLLNEEHLIRDIARMMGKCRKLVRDILDELVFEKLVERKGNLISWRGG